MADSQPASPVDEEDRDEAARAPRWVPTLLVHILYPESRKVGFGWTLFILASVGFLVLRKVDGSPRVESQMWFDCVLISAGLIGFGTLGDAMIALKQVKGGSNAAAS